MIKKTIMALCSLQARGQGSTRWLWTSRVIHHIQKKYEKIRLRSLTHRTRLSRFRWIMASKQSQTRYCRQRAKQCRATGPRRILASITPVTRVALRAKCQMSLINTAQMSSRCAIPIWSARKTTMRRNAKQITKTTKIMKNKMKIISKLTRRPSLHS